MKQNDFDRNVHLLPSRATPVKPDKKQTFRTILIFAVILIFPDSHTFNKSRNFRLANNARLLPDNITNCMLCRNYLTLIAKKKKYIITGSLNEIKIAILLQKMYLHCRNILTELTFKEVQYAD